MITFHFRIQNAGLCCLIAGCCGCDTGSEPSGSTRNLELRTQVVGGVERQVVQAKHGVSFSVSETNVIMWIGDASDFVVAFDPVTSIPESILIKIPAKDDQPAQAVWDYNADGIPEARKVDGSVTNDLLFQGQWYAKHFNGTNLIIFVDGQGILIGWDGHRYVKRGDWNNSTLP